MPPTTLQSPLHGRFAGTDALLLPYGPPDAMVELVGAFEEVGLEYAAIRKGVVLFDEAHTSAVIVRGSDRLAFLNNMVTQRVGDLPPGETRASFWLNRKGRIDADLRVAATPDAACLILDRHLAAPTAEALSNYVFTEDCVIEDASADRHVLALHGVAALAHLAERAGDPALATLGPGRNAPCVIAGVEALADRDDLTGDPGVRVVVPRDAAERVYDALLAPTAAATPRPAGWFALNTARIEAGRPLFNVDFGPDAVPAETGLLADRVDFRKGCYLGQEVVARMDARKVRKRGLVALRVDGDADAPLPGAGDPVFTEDEQTQVGVVTSSTIAPMLGSAVVCFAMVRDAETAPGARLVIRAEGRAAGAVVRPELAFWTR